MISKILIIADASRKASTLILDALRGIQKDQLNVRAILLSFLSFLSEKNVDPLGPNALFLLRQEEKEILEWAKGHFTRLNIPYDFDFITMPAWQEIVDEIENGDQDLIILQGEFLEMLKEGQMDHELRTRMIYRLNCPVLEISPAKDKSCEALGA
jgi:hypothetical protein